jgi:hypothetical protein
MEVVAKTVEQPFTGAERYPHVTSQGRRLPG